MWISELSIKNFFVFDDLCLQFPEPDESKLILFMNSDYQSKIIKMAMQWCFEVEQSNLHRTIVRSLQEYFGGNSNETRIKTQVKLIIIDEDGEKYEVVRTVVFHNMPTAKKCMVRWEKQEIQFVDELCEEQTIQVAEWKSKQRESYIQFPDWNRFDDFERLLNEEKVHLAGQKTLKRTLNDLQIIRNEYADLKENGGKLWGKDFTSKEAIIEYCYVEGLVKVFEKLYLDKLSKFDNELYANISQIQDELRTKYDPESVINKCLNQRIIPWLALVMTRQATNNEFRFLFLDDIIGEFSDEITKKIVGIIFNKFDYQCFVFGESKLSKCIVESADDVYITIYKYDSISKRFIISEDIQ